MKIKKSILNLIILTIIISTLLINTVHAINSETTTANSKEPYISTFNYETCEITLTNKTDPKSDPIILDLKQKQTYNKLEFQKYWPYDSDCLHYEYFSEKNYENINVKKYAESHGGSVYDLIKNVDNYLFMKYTYPSIQELEKNKIKEVSINKVITDLLPKYNIEIDYRQLKPYKIAYLEGDQVIITNNKGEELLNINRNEKNDEVEKIILMKNKFNKELDIRIVLKDELKKKVNWIKNINTATVTCKDCTVKDEQIIAGEKPYQKDIEIKNKEIYLKQKNTIIDENAEYLLIMNNKSKIKNTPSFLKDEGLKMTENGSVYIQTRAKSGDTKSNIISIKFKKGDFIQLTNQQQGSLIKIKSNKPEISLYTKPELTFNYEHVITIRGNEVVESEKPDKKEGITLNNKFSKPTIIQLQSPRSEKIIILKNDQHTVRYISTTKELSEVKKIIHKTSKINEKIAEITQGTKINNEEYIQKLIDSHKEIIFTGTKTINSKQAKQVEQTLDEMPHSLRSVIKNIDFVSYMPENTMGEADSGTYSLCLNNNEEAVDDLKAVIEHESAHLYEYRLNDLIENINHMETGITYDKFEVFKEQNTDLIRQLISTGEFYEIRDMIATIELSKKPHGYYDRTIGVSEEKEYTGDEGCAYWYGCTKPAEDLATIVETVMRFSDPKRDDKDDTYISTSEEFENNLKERYKFTYDELNAKTPRDRIKKKIDLLWRLKFFEENQMNKIILPSERVEFTKDIKEFSNIKLPPNEDHYPKQKLTNTGITEAERKQTADQVLKELQERKNSWILQDIKQQEYIEPDLLIAVIITNIQNEYKENKKLLTLAEYIKRDEFSKNTNISNTPFNKYTNKKNPIKEINKLKLEYQNEITENDLLQKTRILDSDKLTPEEIAKEMKNSINLWYDNKYIIYNKQNKGEYFINLPHVITDIYAGYEMLRKGSLKGTDANNLNVQFKIISNDKSSLLKTIIITTNSIQLNKKSKCKKENILNCNEALNDLIINTNKKTETKIPLIINEEIVLIAYKIWLLEQYVKEQNNGKINITQIGNLYSNGNPSENYAPTKKELETSFFAALGKTYGKVLEENYNYVKQQS